MPFFSVIIPSYNRAAVLPRAITSVINQRFTDWELLIVDDGSTDATQQQVTVFYDSRIQYVYQENKGVCAARNNGANYASGEYLAFLDSDDYVEENWLNDFYEEIKKTNPSIVRCKSIINNQPQEENNGILAGNFVIKKDLFEVIGKYDENLKFGENTEMLFRINMMSPKYGFVDRYNFIYTESRDGGSKNLKNKI